MFHTLLSKDTKTKEEIFQILYPSEPYKDARLRLVFFRAKNILVQFIASQKQSEADRFKSTHGFLHNKDVPKLQKSILKQNYDKLNLLDDGYLFILAMEDAKSKSDAIILQGNRSIEPKLEQAHNTLDEYYFVEKLKLACNTANYTRLSGHEYQLKFLEPIIQFLQLESLESKPLIYLYFHTYQLICLQSEEEFALVYNYLNQRIRIPKNDDYREILVSCLNFCIQKFNRGSSEFAQKTLDIYKLMLNSGNIYQLEKLSPNTYKNIAALGMRLNEYEWVNHFIESEKNNLNSLYPAEDYQLVKARYYYELRDYEKCIQLISQSRPADALDNLQCRSLQCKAYYELDDYDLVDNTIQNAKIFLLRHKSKGYQFRIYANFFKALYRIIHYNYSKKSKLALIASINNEQSIADKQWLDEKLKILLAKN